MNEINGHLLPSRLKREAESALAISGAPESEKLSAFRTHARFIIGQNPDAARNAIADRLWDTAQSHGLPDKFSPDAIQGALREAFDDPIPDDDMTSFNERRGQVRAIDVDTFIKMSLPPRITMLAPWLPSQGSAMIYAPRGTGKTRLVHGICHAIAAGSGFLRWNAPKAFRVLLIDGEMPASQLQEMLKTTVHASQFNPPDSSYFRIAPADLSPDGLPDLADTSAQQFYEDVVADADCVAVDNLSTLCRSLKENDADSWAPVQSWLLSLRRLKKSVILLHHAGKSGSQRGTSKKEDIVDSVISLRRPPDYSAEQGARFEIHFEKSRGFHGPEAEPFEARLIENQWSITAIRTGDDQTTLEALRKQGLSIRDIAERTGLSKSTVQRRIGEQEAE